MEFKEFETFVKNIPNNCVVRVRIADNVLDDEDWTINEIIINGGVCVSQRLVQSGVYVIPNMVNWTTQDIVEWSSWDSTGSPVENYNEVSIGPNLPDKGGIQVWRCMKECCEHREKGFPGWCLFFSSNRGRKKCTYRNCPVLKG